MKIIFPFLK